MRVFDTIRRLTRARRLACLFAFCCAGLIVLQPTIAPAQEGYYERRSILDFFFGRRYLKEDAPPRRYLPPEDYQPPKAPHKPPRPKAVVTPRPVAPAPDAEEPVRKLDTAQKILVVGDFMAGGLGEGLEEAFSDSPGVMVDARTNLASGLVRDDYYNWPSQLSKFVDETKPAVVVVMIGANDRQQMVTDGSKGKFRTDGWFVEYRKRIQAFAKIVSNRKIPLLWVGLPPFDSGVMSADALKFNQLYRTEIESIGGEFIDVWDGFTNADGDFVLTGSDINGQQVRLRGADGIGLTPAGKRKLAFYVEKPVRRLLGTQASPDLGRIDTDTGTSEPKVNAPEHAQPISFSDPKLDGGTALLGDNAPMQHSSETSPRAMLVEQGKLPPAPAGRIDDYRMEDKGKPSASLEAPAASASQQGAN